MNVLDTKRIVLYGILAFVLMFVLVIVFWGFSTGFKYFTAKPSGIAEKERQVQSAEFRIYSYEHFYDMGARIESLEAKLVAQKKKIQKQKEGSEEYSRTLTNIAALEGLIIENKAQYNADAKKEETRGQFRANDLPYSYDLSLPE